MKYKIIAIFVMVAGCLASCNFDDDVVSYPECAITAFSVGDITCKRHTTAHDGSDSTYTVKVGGSAILFNINQLTGEIYNVDSLAPWIDVTQIVPKITANGIVYLMNEFDSLYYAYSSDSVDFSKPRKFAVRAYDQISYKEYTVKINRRSTEAGNLTWNKPDSIELKGDFTLFSINEAPIILNDSLNDVNYDNVVVFKNKLYGLDNTGQVKTSIDGTNWITETTTSVTRLLAADDFCIYALKDGVIQKTTDFHTWTLAGNKHLNMLPEKNISSVAYTSTTNTAIQDVVMLGEINGDSTNVKVWRKVSAKDKELDENWNYINITKENNRALPVMNNMSNMVRYNSQLFVFGKGYFYISKDGGITWEQQTNKVMAPEGIKEGRRVRLFVKDNALYLYQSGESEEKGKVWKGIIGA